MQDTRQNKAQTEIKIARRNINNFRYADDTTLMAEREEEMISLLMKAKKESEQLLKNRDITLPTKVCLVKAMVFPVVMYGCES